jgi:hypothetical protein
MVATRAAAAVAAAADSAACSSLYTLRKQTYDVECTLTCGAGCWLVLFSIASTGKPFTNYDVKLITMERLLLITTALQTPLVAVWHWPFNCICHAAAAGRQ